MGLCPMACLLSIFYPAFTSQYIKVLFSRKESKMLKKGGETVIVLLLSGWSVIGVSVVVLYSGFLFSWGWSMLRGGKGISLTLYRDCLYLHLIRNRGGWFLSRSRRFLAADLGIHWVFIITRGVVFLRGGLLSP